MRDTGKNGMGRREFIGTAAAALFAGVAIQITGCGSDSSSGPALGEGDVAASSISGNHGHSAIITKAQLDAGGAVTLTVKGSASHSHTLDISADEVAAIKAGTPTMISHNTSTTNGHSHMIHFN